MSAQAAPNLTPLLDEAFKPVRLVMVVSADMRQRAEWLAQVARQRGIKVETLPVQDAWSLDGIADELMNWLVAQGPDADVVLNVTGGTKPMAMAAQDVFAMEGKPVFYVHPKRDEVLWLARDRAPQALQNKLTLKPYLQAHGWDVVDRPQPVSMSRQMNGLCDSLVQRLGTYGRPLGTLNRYASECAKQGVLKIRLDDHDWDSIGFRALTDEFSAVDALTVSGSELSFSSEAARAFCNGGWLEQFVFATLNEMRTELGIQDMAGSLRVRTLDNQLAGGHGGNELDVAFLAHNRLHIIECKTANFSGNDSAAPTVYKLDSLTGMGGLNTRGLLASYRPLVEGDRQRARDLRIELVEGAKLATLRQQLVKWVGAAL